MPDTPPSTLRVYRVGDGRFPLFDGRGAMLHGGRWNSPGHPVIYGSCSQAGAMLELLVHASIGKLPRNTAMVTIDIPETLVVETLEPEALPGWGKLDNKISCVFGDEWITNKRSAVLLVPSVVAPFDKNVVINTMHPEFSKIIASEHLPLIWDERLFPKKEI